MSNIVYTVYCILYRDSHVKSSRVVNHDRKSKSYISFERSLFRTRYKSTFYLYDAKAIRRFGISKTNLNKRTKTPRAVKKLLTSFCINKWSCIGKNLLSDQILWSNLTLPDLQWLASIHLLS